MAAESLAITLKINPLSETCIYTGKPEINEVY